MLVRQFALLMGVLFVLAGIGGFVPLVTPAAHPGAPPLHVTASYGYLLGLFPINAVHNALHLAFGIGGLAAARNYAAARRYARLLAVALGALTLLGLVPATATAWGLLPLYGHDIWLHALEALAGAYLGFSPATYLPGVAHEEALDAGV
jgi:hypothetical protein